MSPISLRTSCAAAGIAVAAAAALAGTAASASATNYTWRNAQLGANADDYGTSYAGFTGSGGSSDHPQHQVKVAAHLPGGHTIYANWTSASQYACHSYEARELGAAILNNNSVAQNPVIGSFQLYGGGC